jgi:V/A-type H+-transporting ATPase subunit D
MLDPQPNFGGCVTEGWYVKQTVATRTELLATGQQIALATQARDLLVDKRTELVKAFRSVADVVLEESERLEEAAADAGRRLAWAEATEGPEPVWSAGLAATGEVFLKARTESIMGVRVPEIDAPPVGRRFDRRGYSLAATSPAIDAVADAFEWELDVLLHVAAREIRARRLAAEIGATTRRVNALEHILLPRLRERHRRLRLVLDEREREDHFRLRRARNLRGRR